MNRTAARILLLSLLCASNAALAQDRPEDSPIPGFPIPDAVIQGEVEDGRVVFWQFRHVAEADSTEIQEIIAFQRMADALRPYLEVFGAQVQFTVGDPFQIKSNTGATVTFYAEQFDNCCIFAAIGPNNTQFMTFNPTYDEAMYEFLLWDLLMYLE